MASIVLGNQPSFDGSTLNETPAIVAIITVLHPGVPLAFRNTDIKSLQTILMDNKTADTVLFSTLSNWSK